MALRINGLDVTLSINDTQDDNALQNAMRCYAECHILFIIMLNVIMLNVIMLSVVLVVDHFSFQNKFFFSFFIQIHVFLVNFCEG